MNKQEALSALRGIVASHSDYEAFASDLISEDASIIKECLSEILLDSAGNGDLDVLKLAHLAGGDLECRNEGGGLAHLAVTTGASVEILKYLVSHKVNLGAPDSIGRTPAHIAAEDGVLESLKFLSEQKVDLDARDSYGLAPVHAAAAFKRSKCLQLMADLNVNMNAADNKGRTKEYWEGKAQKYSFYPF